LEQGAVTTPTNAEETWWHVTYPNGSILQLPAPSRTIGDAQQPEQDGTVRLLKELLDPAKALINAKNSVKERVISSVSRSGRQYVLDIADALMIQVVVISPERLAAALMKASQSRASSSTSGQTPASPSDDQENPSGRSIGARIRRPTRH
jgi:hypothetical protein